jgi:hypothetical protein
MSNTVISICSLSHADVWKLTAQLMPEMLEADRYIVYVPEIEVPYFLEVTPSNIEVKSQNQLGESYRDKLLQVIRLAGNEKRYGWYLQQFHKIEAIQLADTDTVTIWDADCVPVSKIEITNLRNKIIYVNSSREFHQPYFDNIRKLLGLVRIQDICFVIPSFPMKREWIRELISFVEAKHGLRWYDAIIQTTDFSLMSGFSETETMGTWVANMYPGKWESRAGTWERFGQSRFGYAKNITASELRNLGKSNNLEIITFENWDLRGIKRVLNRTKRIFFKLR